uniref:PRANC domain-containing protein n=1 Tax=Trichogramma kaykai TaxID=54128 RepID=A0ABD2VXT8_9HYME
MQKTNESPLHLAIYFGHKEVVELLLRNGADPNLADAKGLTPLHVICKRDENDDGLLERFFEINDEKHQLVRVNARDTFGNTPLHSLYKFARYDHLMVAKFLLQKGADPNLANEDGSTLLHLICKRDSNDEERLTEVLIQLCDEVNRPVQVDVVDKLMGQTPLHLAVEYCCQEVVEELLRAGTDPNLADVEGLTPLHIICQRRPGDDLASSFFYYTDELQQTVLVNARDKLGRTPLQSAVARFLPKTVNELLNRGADLSSFVFPTDSYFSEKFNSRKYCWLTFKLRLVSGALDVVKNLEKRGYEFQQSDALAFMKFFAKNELFEKSSEDFDQASFYRFEKLPKEPSLACAQHLSEIIFRRWSLEPLLELTDHYQLPILCCEIIIEKLTNEELCNVCLAAAGQNS